MNNYQGMMSSLSTLMSSPMIWITFIFGACIGSFLNVVILRVPEGTFFKSMRSVCPQCQTKIPAWNNIPIFSWLLLRGKTKCCQKKLPLQYLVIEVMTALAFVYAYIIHPFFGFSMHPDLWDTADAIRYVHGVTFFSLLLTCSAIDLKHMIIPDVISLPMIAISPLIAWIHPDLTIVDSLIGVVAGGGFLYLVAWLYWLIRKGYGMGFGDVKLLAAIGGWVGYQGIFPTLFLGSIIGSIIGISAMAFGNRMSWQSKIPFGPFLAGGAIFFLWFRSQFVDYLSGF